MVILRDSILIIGVSQVVLVVKNLLASSGDTRDAGLIPESEDPLEEGMAIQSNILDWRIPWPEKPGGPQSIRLGRVEHNLRDLTCTY